MEPGLLLARFPITTLDREPRQIFRQVLLFFSYSD